MGDSLRGGGGVGSQCLFVLVQQVLTPETTAKCPFVGFSSQDKKEKGWPFPRNLILYKIPFQ